MGEDGKEKDFRSVQSQREQAWKDVEELFPWKTGLEKEFEAEVMLFESIDSSQVTRELAINLLTVEEKFWRERANQELADNRGDSLEEMSFDKWSEQHSALMGATGKEPVSTAIDFLRRQASIKRVKARELHQELSGQEPVNAGNTNLFEHINRISGNLPRFKKAAENYDTAARLFENQVDFSVVADGMDKK